MKTNSPQQGNLIEPPTAIDFSKLITEAKLSKNEQGILKRRLIESRKPFEVFLQLLFREVEKEKITPDIPQSLKNLEENEKREIASFDAIAKELSKDFPELLQFILEEYQVEAEKTKVMIGKEFISIKRIADVIFEAKDKEGNDVIIHLEFERKYKSDEHMDKRTLEYRHLMEMDDDYKGKEILCNVFYLKGSPKSKKEIEEREIEFPKSDPRYSGRLKYKAYHLSLIKIETIIKRNLPFLLPFIVESELEAIKEEKDFATRYITSLRQQIDAHKEDLEKMIKELTPKKLESLQITVEYLWGKRYSNEVFNQSSLFELMRDRLNLRQDDIQWGINEGINKMFSEEQAVAKQMAQEGKLTEEVQEFLRRLKEFHKDEK
ncbi:MAG: hypothetical protein ABFS56_22935 [Pseudomonadota bacterium]